MSENQKQNLENQNQTKISNQDILDYFDKIKSTHEEQKKILDTDWTWDLNTIELEKAQENIVKKVAIFNNIVKGINDFKKSNQEEESWYDSFIPDTDIDEIYDSVLDIPENLLDSANEYRKEKIVEIAKELMSKWNIPDNETIISVLDKIQYIVTWEEDKKIDELIKKLEKSEEWNSILQLEASNIIWEFTWLSWFSVFNTTQELMISKIFKDNKWFNDELLMWYNDKVWNFIISIDDFKSDIHNKPLEEWNSLALSNYFEYLKSNWDLNSEVLQNPKIFWKEKLIELWKFWIKNPKDAIAKKILEENWLWEIVEEVMDFSKFFDDILNTNNLQLKNINEKIDNPITQMNNLSNDELIWAKDYLEKNSDTAIKLTEKFQSCPDEWTNSRDLLEKWKEIKFNIQIDKLWLKKYSNKEWLTADVYLKDLIKKDFCASTMVNWLDDFLDSSWEEMDFDQIKNILWTYVEIKNKKIKFEFKEILSEDNIDKLSKISNKKEREKFIKKYSTKKLNEQELNTYINLSYSLIKIWLIDKVWLEQATHDSLKSWNGKSFINLLENSDSINEVQKILLENESKYLKVLNSLNIYNYTVTNIKVVLNSDLALKKLEEIEKAWLLTDEQSELMWLLIWLDYVNKDSKKIIKEQYKIKKEREKYKINEQNINNNKTKLYILNNNYFITTEESYNKIEGWYTLIWKDWKTIEWLIISEEEKKLTMWNPEATENLIHFYEFFKELNLESVWDYRKELMISMWNRNINFIDNDSLSKSELIQFWNNLILSINNLIWNKKEFKNKPKLLITNSLSWLKNELRKFSWAWSILSDEKTHDIKWEDKFAATLRNLWIIWWAYFKINLFRESIK